MFEIIALIQAVLYVFSLIAVVILTFVEIVDWFQERRRLITADKDNLAFTLKTKLANNDFDVVQGVINTRTEQVIDGRKIKADKLDQKIKNKHRTKELVVYQ